MSNRSALAVALSLAIVSPTPSWAAALVAPTATPHANTVVAPVVLPMGGVIGNFGAGIQTQAGLQSALPSLAPVSVSPALQAPSGLPTVQSRSLQAQGVSAQAVLSGVAAARSVTPAKGASVQASQTPVNAKNVAAVSSQVRDILHDAGPVQDSRAESAVSLGDRIFSFLIGGFSGKSDDAPAPAQSTQMELPLQPADAENASRLARNPEASLNITQKKMLQTLDYVASIYTEHYAPLGWKQQNGVDLKKVYQDIRKQVVDTPNMSFRQFQNLLAKFVASTKDYHTGIQFFSTEKAKLPLFIMQAEGKYYIAYVDRTKLSEAEFPYQVGDEVVEFAGKPTAEAIEDIVKATGENVRSTDLRLAEMRLTSRIRQTGAEVPQGPVGLKIKTSDGVEHVVTLEWAYQGEVVPQDVPVLDGGLDAQTQQMDLGLGRADLDIPSRSVAQKIVDALRAAVRKLLPDAAHPHAQIFKSNAEADSANKFIIGSRESYVPKLGKVLWEMPKNMPLHAYIFENAAGKLIGYVRIPHYMGEEKEAALFAQLIAQLEKKTDGLIIDQLNNPGGSLFYMYSLLSNLTDKPLIVPQHKLLVDESDAYWAAQMMEEAAKEGAEKEVVKAMKKEFNLSVDDGLTQKVLGYAKFIIDELKSGRRLTRLFHLFGIDKIAPHPVAHYTKPMLLLINALDFSCGDFFPAILQDNKRATLMGVRTSGAGGGVKSMEFLNQFGIAQLAYTWTIAERPNGQPIENLGVTPDIKYDLTANDLKNNFSDYVKAINAAIDAMVPKAEAKAVLEAEAKEAAAKAKAKAEAKQKAKDAGKTDAEADAAAPADWGKVASFVEANGRNLPKKTVEQFSAIFELPAGLSMKGLGVQAQGQDGQPQQHMISAFGTKDEKGAFQTAGYILMGETDMGPYAIVTDAKGAVLRAGQVTSPTEFTEQPISEMEPVIEAVQGFWASVAGQGAEEDGGNPEDPTAQ